MMTIRPAAHVKAIIDADGAVLLDLKRGKYFALNDVGADIWGHIEARHDATAIEEALSDVYDVSREDVRQDVAAFLAMLTQNGLVSQES